MDQSYKNINPTDPRYISSVFAIDEPVWGAKIHCRCER